MREKHLENRFALKRYRQKILGLTKNRAGNTGGQPDVPPEKGMERYRIEVGNRHGLRPKDVLGAISNEAGLDSRHIGQIRIEPDYSFVDLPFGMPGNTFQLLRKTWIRSRRMAISKCA